MKKLIGLLLLVGLGAGAAWAQNPPTANITTSLQGSQFGNGPVGVDTSTNYYFKGHVNSFSQSGAISAQTCGNSIVNSAATDNVALFTTGVVTACQLVFGQPFVNIPACFVSIPGSTVLPTYTVATTGVNISAGLGGAAAQKVQSLCLGND